MSRPSNHRIGDRPNNVLGSGNHKDAWSEGSSYGSPETYTQPLEPASAQNQRPEALSSPPGYSFTLERWLYPDQGSTPGLKHEGLWVSGEFNRCEQVSPGKERFPSLLYAVESRDRPHLQGSPHLGGYPVRATSALNLPEENDSQLTSLPEKSASETSAASGESFTYPTMSGFIHQTSSPPTSPGSPDIKQKLATRLIASFPRSIDDNTMADEEELSLSFLSGESDDEPEDTLDHDILTENCKERLADPREYFRMLELLEESIFLHSALFFHTSSSSTSKFQMPFPEFEILEDTDPQMFDMLRNANAEQSLPQKGVRLHLLHVRNIVFSVYVNLMRLKLARYCEDFISLLVMDQMRPDHVAKLVALPLLEVKRLAQAFNYASNKEDNHTSEYSDLNEGCYRILALLGDPSIFHVSGTSNLDILWQREEALATAIHMWYCVAHTLDLAVLSYSGAHIENFDETYLGARQESFKIPSQFLAVDDLENIWNSGTKLMPTLCLRRRSLQCLNDFLNREVWVFHTLPDSQRHDKLYLQTDIQTFADIWGPLWASSLNSKPDEFYQLNVGNGTILACPTDPVLEECAIPSSGEVFCHWVSWREVRVNSQLLRGKSVKRHLRLRDKLLIGAPPNSFLELTQNDNCQRDVSDIKQDLSDHHALNHPGTLRRDRVKDSQTIAVSAGGLGMTASASITYKRRDGQTWKDALVESWRDLEFVNIVSLRCYVGLEVSLCTKNARRIRLLDVLNTKTMRLYLKGREFDWEEDDKHLEEKYFKALGSPETFRILWSIRKYRKIVGKAISYCIDALDETGVDEVTGALNALWVVEAYIPDSDMDRSLSKDHPPADESQPGSGSECGSELTLTEEYIVSLFRSECTWTRFLTDTRETLTMAVVEDNCLEFKPKYGRLCTSERPVEDGNNGCPVLQTRLEINEQFLKKEGVVKVTPEGALPYWDVLNTEKKTRFLLGEQGVLEVIDNPNSNRSLRKGKANRSPRKGKAKTNTESNDETQPLVVDWDEVKSKTFRGVKDLDIQQTFCGKNPKYHHTEYSFAAFRIRPIPIFILSKSKKIGLFDSLRRGNVTINYYDLCTVLTTH